MSEKPTIANELAALPHVPVTSLAPFQGNLKELTAREYSKLKKSLQENGVIVPFFVWAETGKLLDGHQRRRVFESEGWEVDVPVVYISADDEQDAKRKLLVISSQYGKVTQEGFDEFTFDLDGEWILETANFDALPFVFEGLPDDPEPEDAEPQISRADELREQWGTELGQLWRLPSRTDGQDHRLICGDCTDVAVVERVMGGCADAVGFTSPPYNLGRNIEISNRSQSLKDTGSAYAGGADARTELDYYELLCSFTDAALLFCNYVLVNVQSLAGNKVALIDWLHQYKDRFADVAVWHKTNQQPAMATGVMNSSFEYIYFISREHRPSRAIKSAEFRGTFDNVYTSPINTNEYADVHGAAFPVSFAEHFLRGFCPGVCLDSFCGLGTTIIAAENLSRQCRAVEISPAYVAVALQRYKDAFGIEPELVQ